MLRALLGNSKSNATLANSDSRSFENPANSLYLNNLIGSSSAGATVNQVTMFSIAPVWQAVNMISGDIARLPLEMFDVDLETSSMKVNYSHKIARLVRWQPNSMQHAVEFWRTLVTDYLIWNRAFAWIKYENGSIAEIVPLAVPYMYWDKERQLWMVYADKDIVALYPYEVFELKGMRSSCFTPQLISMARQSFGLAKAAEDFNNSFFQNGANSGGILEVPPNYTKKAADNLEEGFRKRTGKDNWFKTVVLRDGAKFHQTTIDPEKSQTHELRTDQVADIARWYNLPPSKLGLENSVSYNSKQEDNRAYVDQTLAPILSSIRAEAWFKLLSESEKDSLRLQFMHNLDSLLDSDPKTKAEVEAIKITNGISSFNESRKRFMMNPREGGDSFVVPMNMTIVDAITGLPEQDDMPTTEVQQNALQHELALRYFESVMKSHADILINKVAKEHKRKDSQRFVSWYKDTRAELYTDFVSACVEKLGDRFKPHSINLVDKILSSIDKAIDNNRSLDASSILNDKEKLLCLNEEQLLLAIA